MVGEKMLRPKSNTVISNQTFKIKPWEDCAIKIQKAINNVTIENCTIERLSWRKWFASLFHF